MTLPSMDGAFRCVKDPVLRFSQGGMAICSFTAVADKKKKNEATGEWVDDKVIFIKITTFKQLAEHVAESVTKGTNVIITNTQASVSEWEAEDGSKRSTIEVVANDLGVSLFWNTVKVQETQRSGGEAQRGAPSENPWATTPAPAAQQANPWAAPSQGQPDQPPF